MRKVEVIAYREEWTSLFNTEAELLRAIFGEELIDIHHIGSTSVPGLAAKPIIDLMPVVKELNRVDHYNTEMQRLGYEPKGENGIASRRYFQKGGDNRTHHVHVFQSGNHEITRHLAFRDYLRRHPIARKEYGNLKVQLANQFPWDMDAYINGKNELVKNIEQRAMEWYHLWK